MKLPAIRPFIFLLGLLIILGLIFNFSLASIIVSLILTYHLFKAWLDPYIFDSRLTRILLTPFFYALVLQCVILFAWIINRNFPLDTSATFCLLFLVFLSVYTHYLKDKKENKGFATGCESANGSDYVALATAFIITATILITSAIAGGASNRSSLLNLVNGNVDDAAHIALVNDRLQFNRGILYHTDVAGQVRNPSPYPLGWHSVNAAFIKAVYPSIQPGTQSLSAYIVTKVIWFFVLAFVFVKTVFIFLKVIRNKPPIPLSKSPWLVVMPLLFVGIFLVDFFCDGFYSFIPQVIAILLMAAVVLQIKQTKKAKTFYSTLPILAILAVSGSLPWLLIMPALLVAVFVFLLQRWKLVGTQHIAKELLSHIIQHAPLYILLAGALLVQYYTYSQDTTSVSFLQGILLVGGTPVYGNLFYIFVIVGLVLCMAAMPKRAMPYLNNLIILIGCILSLSFVVYVLQITHIGANAYYYFKIMSAIMAIMIPLALVGYALGLEWLFRNLDQSATIWATLVIVILLVPQLVSISPIRYLGGYREASRQLNESVYKQLRQVDTISNYNDNTYTFYLITGKPAASDFGTMMAKSAKPNSACFNTARFSISIRGTLSYGTNAIKRDCGGKYSLTVITNPDDVDDLNRTITSSGLTGIVRISAQQGL